MSTAMLAGSRIQLQQPAGLGGSRLQRAAAPVAAAARLGSVRPTGLQARSTAARRADRNALRVSATASPEAAPVKLSGDDLKEANRKHMRSVRFPPTWAAAAAHSPSAPCMHAAACSRPAQQRNSRCLHAPNAAVCSQQARCPKVSLQRRQ